MPRLVQIFWKSAVVTIDLFLPAEEDALFALLRSIHSSVLVGVNYIAACM